MEQISQVVKIHVVKRLEGHQADLLYNTGFDWQPVQRFQRKGYVVIIFGSSDNSGSGVLDGLKFLKVTFWHIDQ